MEGKRSEGGIYENSDFSVKWLTGLDLNGADFFAPDRVLLRIKALGPNQVEDLDDWTRTTGPARAFMKSISIP